MSERRLISTGSPFEMAAGYSRAVADGDFVFVSGTTGYDYATMHMPESVEEQTHACFRSIAAALEEAGATLADVVRVRYIITDVAYADAVFPIFGQYFGTVRPAATLIVAGLLKPEIKIEIEVTARRPG
ncbi:MAG TPA: RidA family protein [Xanthobacteraceae bacterium]|nr:RidA family protein [Xanthobacteraceae bacterium]